MTTERQVSSDVSLLTLNAGLKLLFDHSYRDSSLNFQTGEAELQFSSISVAIYLAIFQKNSGIQFT